MIMNFFFFYRNVKRSKDYGKNVVWPKPPNILESLVVQHSSHNLTYGVLTVTLPLGSLGHLEV
jgi:hypothetical protein